MSETLANLKPERQLPVASRRKPQIRALARTKICQFEWKKPGRDRCVSFSHIGVITRDRPAAAPQTDDFDLGYRAIGSAGTTVKRVTYGIALPGLVISGWSGTWLGCTVGMAAISFILACAIPIFNYVLALVGSLCCAPLATSLLGWLWLLPHGPYRTGNSFPPDGPVCGACADNSGP
ncbi:hypothetical protein NUU61_001914 [Penicillium alfredii]|uniref:Uncharacterized protein n=1 Tax=Penicillium alfredii TaxID=1506179 RepID=A0A9W9KGT3_9EURO|nr:uncharacterized protein NUU61_001914 [Penicillium alfredii]KAJ5104567.1 hypothetical protein NUU61_001914 [Penicillium alfredii]